jgi:hypothetical protein
VRRGAHEPESSKDLSMPKLDVTVAGNAVRIGERFSVTFHRTLRIPVDDRSYPLPPGLGRLPVHRFRDVVERESGGSLAMDELFVPLSQGEALWLGFEAASWKPNAVKIGVGGVNAVSGEPWDIQLRDDPQDYLVCPPQLWLDGINSGTGIVRQFVAMPLGSGMTVEGQVSGVEQVGGIQLVVFEPCVGRFPEHPPRLDERTPGALATPATMGLGAGGEIRQKLYPDPYGLDTWDPDVQGHVSVRILNSQQYLQLTGKRLPASPIDVATYRAHGLPWFALYDEEMGDLPASASLAGVEPVPERDSESQECP